jgi:hypothetical protein
MTIKDSTSTQFPVGSFVKVVDKGQVCTTYRDMADHMRLVQRGYEWAQGWNVLEGGEVGVVVAKAMHQAECNGEILAIKVGEKVSLILSKGVVEYELVIKEPTLQWEDLKAGQKVKFVGGTGLHPWWKFDIGGVYSVEQDGDRPAVMDNDDDPCYANYDNWEIVLVEDVAKPDTTVEELKAELATVKAKLWDAEQKLKKITAVAAEVAS